MSERTFQGAPPAIAAAASGKNKVVQIAKVGCLSVVILSAACVIPVWAWGWYSASDTTTVAAPTLLSGPTHPRQIIGAVPSGIQCPSGTWVMQWTEGGKLHETCTPSWE